MRRFARAGLAALAAVLSVIPAASASAGATVSPLFGSWNGKSWKLVTAR